MNRQRILTALVLAAIAATAGAQTPPPPPTAPGTGNPPPMMQRGPGMEPGHMQGMPGMRGGDGRWGERMQERMAQRMNRLKETLRIAPNQEGAWTAFTTAMRPAPRQRPDLGEWARLTTPERIDRMRGLRQQRMAEMDRRADATKTLYAALTPEQKRVFDQVTLQRFGGRGMGMGGEGMGRHHFGHRHGG